MITTIPDNATFACGRVELHTVHISFSIVCVYTTTQDGLPSGHAVRCGLPSPFRQLCMTSCVAQCKQSQCDVPPLKLRKLPEQLLG